MDDKLYCGKQRTCWATYDFDSVLQNLKIIPKSISFFNKPYTDHETSGWVCAKLKAGVNIARSKT